MPNTQTKGVDKKQDQNVIAIQIYDVLKLISTRWEMSQRAIKIIEIENGFLLFAATFSASGNSPFDAEIKVNPFFWLACVTSVPTRKSLGHASAKLDKGRKIHPFRKKTEN